MVDAMQSCSSRAGMTTVRSESDDVGVVMRRTGPANSEVLLPAPLFCRGFLPRASRSGNAIPLPLELYRAPSLEYRRAEESGRRQFPVARNASRTMHLVAPATWCLLHCHQHCSRDGASSKATNPGDKNFHSQITDYIEVSLTKRSMRWLFKQKVEESGSRKENETQARKQCQDG